MMGRQSNALLILFDKNPIKDYAKSMPIKHSIHIIRNLTTPNVIESNSA